MTRTITPFPRLSSSFSLSIRFLLVAFALSRFPARATSREPFYFSCFFGRRPRRPRPRSGSLTIHFFGKQMAALASIATRITGTFRRPADRAKGYDALTYGRHQYSLWHDRFRFLGDKCLPVHVSAGRRKPLAFNSAGTPGSSRRMTTPPASRPSFREEAPSRSAMGRWMPRLDSSPCETRT